MQGGSKGAGAVLLLAMLAGAAGGFVAGMLVADGMPAHVQVPQATGGEDTLVPELRALAVEVAALRQQLQREPTGIGALAPGAPQPLAPSGDADLGVLAAALQQALAAAPRADGGGERLVLPPPDPERHARATALLDLDDVDLRTSHRLWPAQDVLDQYGLPDEIYVSDAVEKWVWRDSAGNGAVLVLFRGHVVEVDRW